MTEMTAKSESFADLLEESLADIERFEGTVTTGTIIEISNDFAIVDVGLKAEGRIPLKEFAPPGMAAEVKIGDKVDIEA